MRILSSVIFSFLFGTAAMAEPLAITPDGLFSDWTTSESLHVDAEGDGGPSEIDFHRLWAAHDAERVFFRFETGTELILQEAQGLALYVDADDDDSTGLGEGGIGAEFRWEFGGGNATVYAADGSQRDSSRWLPFGVRQSPTVSGSSFELAFERSASLAGVAPFAGSSFSFALRDETPLGDRQPDGGGVVYTFTGDAPESPPALSLPKNEESHFRIVSHNVRRDGYFDDPAPFRRMYAAIDADVFCFQEIYNHSAQEMETEIENLLGGNWHSAENADCIVVSRHQLSLRRELDGNLGILVDLPEDRYREDLYIVNAHLPCCGNDEGRQAEVDRIMSWVRDLRTPGGDATLADGTALVITGDMNFVGLKRQVQTLVQGDIQNEGEFGPDFSPDWDGTPLADALPRHVARRDVYTWRSDGSRFTPGRLDFLFYSDSVAAAANRFLLWTPEIDPASLASAGLQAADARASDHLPLVVDLEFDFATLDSNHWRIE